MPKAPTTPDKKTVHSPYPSPGSSSGEVPLTSRKGPLISKTRAMSNFHLSLDDLGTILPVYIGPNPWGAGIMYQYNLSDVRALAKRIGAPPPKTDFGDVELAERNGPSIMRTNARNIYNLTPDQMDTIKPVSCTPNQYDGMTRFYNLCDVVDLFKRENPGTTVPTLSYKAPCGCEYDYGYDLGYEDEIEYGEYGEDDGYEYEGEYEYEGGDFGEDGDQEDNEEASEYDDLDGGGEDQDNSDSEDQDQDQDEIRNTTSGYSHEAPEVMAPSQMVSQRRLLVN